MRLFLYIFFFLNILSGQTNRLEYYFSEVDFLSNNAVPLSEVIGKNYLVVEYGSDDILTSKTWLGLSGKPDKKEEFFYDDQQNLLSIEKKDKDDNLFEKVLFGMESHSIQFLQYLMAFDSVFAGDDRFTIIQYDEDRISNYQFYDVNHLIYGEMGFFYDSTETINEHIWIKHPGKQIVRRWTYRYIPDEERTQVTEWDTTGSIVYDTYLADDGSESVFTILVNTDTLFTNRPLIPYDLDASLLWGTIQWEWIGGNRDSIETHTYNLSGHELNNLGQHELRPELSTQLENGALYRLTFHGETTRRYSATVTSFEPIVFDRDSPKIVGSLNDITSTLVLEINASEPLQSIDIEIRQDDIQFGYPIIYSFPDSILPVKNGQFPIPVMAELIEQIPYRVFMTGKDRAGNYGLTADIGIFVYDNTPPQISISHPENHDYFNYPDISFTLSEPLSSASIAIATLSGEDLITVKIIKLDEEILEPGEQTLSLEYSYKFNDKSYYSFSLYGSDFAGNMSDTVFVDSLYYDITPPEVSVIFPYDSAVINEPSMSYISNEQLSRAVMEWIHIVGTADTIAPYFVELTGNELIPNEKIRKSLPVTTGLRDGAIYTIYLSAWDIAGNEIDKIQIDNVLFDASPPVLSLSMPKSNTITNSLALSYSSTEYLKEGILTIERFGGEPDTKSPYIVELYGFELNDGNHDDVQLDAMPSLNSGTEYSYTLTGFDLGENKADPVSVTQILYDNIAPDFQVSFPSPNSINTRKAFEFTLSEDLIDGYCLLLQSGGAQDSLSPHIIPLFEDDLLSGEHKINIDNLAIMETSQYELQVIGIDYAGNSTDTIYIHEIIYDVTPPKMTISFPKSKSLNTQLEIEYTLSERLDSAHAIWTRIGGENDPNSPHRIPLNEDESIAGHHSYLSLKNQSELMSGTIYSLTFEGQDVANHPLVVKSIENITYDFIAPVADLILPISNTISNESIIGYNLLESTIYGRIEIHQVGGDLDPKSPLKINLEGENLSAGPHQIQLQQIDDIHLTNNSIYNIWMVGEDQAGNSLISDTIRHFTYDNSAPVLTMRHPAKNDFINTVLIAYENNERLETAQMTWEDETTGEIQNVGLSGNELLEGLKTNQLLQQTPNLIDGHRYTLTISGRDIAGNISLPIVQNHITYDITKPSLVVDNLNSNDFIKSSNVSYRISEKLAEAKFEWITYDESGKENVITYLLSNELLLAGQFELIEHYNPGLSDGQIYDLNITYSDSAGNKGEDIKLSRLNYDSGPPTLVVLFPAENSFMKENRLEVLLSESIQNLTIEHSGSDYNLNVMNIDTLIRSKKIDWDGFFNQFSVRDGIPFDIRLKATDMAGNESDFIEVRNITIDDTPPEITFSLPKSRTVLNRLQPTIITSEELGEAELTITPNKGSPESFQLSENQLEAGTQKLEEYSLSFDDNIAFTMQIKGRDLAGNESESNKLEYLRFDRRKPELLLTNPAENSLINNLSIEFENTENLSKAALVLIAEVSQDSIEIGLIDDYLTKGSKNLKDRLEFKGLEEDSEYEIAIWGMDHAGNASDTSRIHGLRFDYSSPDLSIDYPESNTFIKDKTLTYSLSENLKGGSINITWVGGIPDSVRNYTIDLTENQLLFGTNKKLLLDSDYPIVSGGIYKFALQGSDIAGNVSLPATIENIHFDNKSPLIDIIDPVSETTLSDLSISYKISEELAEGELIVEKIRERQTQPKIEIELIKDDLKPGDHNKTSLPSALKLEEGDIISISIKGVDRAGNKGSSNSIKNIRFDNKSPVIILSEPQSNSLSNKLAFSMIYSEQLSVCSFEITRIDGPVDTNAPYSFFAAQNELDQTVFDSFQFQESPILVDDVRYQITVKGIDFAGNESAAVIIEGFKLDTEAPTYSISQPIDGEKIASEKISYMLSDNLGMGEVIFTYQSGSPDPHKRHVAVLKKENKTQGPHFDIPLEFDAPLTDGVKYIISLEGADKAGNPLEGQPASQVLFDAVPPVITWLSPESNIRLNQLLLSYTLSEDLSLAKLEATDENGTTQTIELSANERTAGEQRISIGDRLTIDEELPLSYRLIGIDLAGNQSESQDISNIILDTTIPSFTVSAPEDAERIRRFLVSYELSELLDTFDIEIIRTAGEPDAKSPYKIDLPSYLYRKGRFESIDLEQYASLVDGAEYKIGFTGRDKAGNAFSKVMINNLVLDRIAPQVTVVQPKPESFTKKKLLQFETFEPLIEGKIEWIWQSGNSDTENHVINLSEDLLGIGEKSVTEIENIKFVSGANYHVKFTLTDRAKNVTEHLITNVTYDYEAPIVTPIQPLTNQRINIETLKFSTDEPLRICRITWVDQTTNEAHLYLIPRDKVSATEFVVEKAESKLLMIDSHTYQIRIFARDQAGNQKEVVFADSVIFDTKPPVFTQIIPNANGATNSSAVSYNLNEPCQSGRLVWMRISGPNDPASPHIIDLQAYLLKQNINSTISLPVKPLVEGATYAMVLSATDLLGNKSRQFNTPNIIIDRENPIVQIKNLESGSAIKSIEILISTNEPLKSAILEFIQTGGDKDSESPQRIEIDPSYFENPNTQGIQISNLAALNSGSIYSITFEGMDIAGNSTISAMISNILFDNIIPELTILSPTAQTVLNTGKVDISLSEELNSAMLIWENETNTSQKPITMEIPVKFLKAGEHYQIPIETNLQFDDSVTYSLFIEGNDRAGNIGKSAAIPGIIMSASSE